MNGSAPSTRQEWFKTIVSIGWSIVYTVCRKSGSQVLQQVCGAQKLPRKVGRYIFATKQLSLIGIPQLPIRDQVLLDQPELSDSGEEKNHFLVPSFQVKRPIRLTPWMLNWRANKSCSRIRQIYCRAHKLSYKTICPSASRTSISVCRWVRIEAIFTSRSLEKIMKFSTWKMAEAVVIFRFRICPHFAILESSERPMDTSVILNKNTFRCRAFYISKYNKRRKTPL